MAELLALLVALIVAAQSPQVPQDLRIQALTVASIAIQYIKNTPPETPFFTGISTTTIVSVVNIPQITPQTVDAAVQKANESAIHLANLRSQIAEYDRQITEYDVQIAQINADHKKKGTSVNAYEMMIWNKSIQELEENRALLVRAQAPLLVEFESLK